MRGGGGNELTADRSAKMSAGGGSIDKQSLLITAF